jgi:hypothetical protein
MNNVMTPDQAMSVVKEKGYSLILKDRDFHIEPPDGLNKIGQVLPSLKNEMLSALALMDSIIKWADNDRKKWGSLHKIVKEYWEPALYAATPSGTLFDWTGNRMAYSSGLQHANTPDISFFSRVVEHLEERVPEALVQEKKVASRLRKKITGASVKSSAVMNDSTT